MIRSFPWPRVFATAAVALVWVFCGARTALATCGDWLMDSNEHQAAMPDGNGHFDPADPHAPALPCPCNGPYCQGSPDAPLSPVPVFHPPLQRPDGALQRLSSLLWDTRFCGRAPGADDRLPEGYPQSIDRPPRV